MLSWVECPEDPVICFINFSVSCFVQYEQGLRPEWEAAEGEITDDESAIGEITDDESEVRNLVVFCLIVFGLCCVRKFSYAVVDF